MGYGSRHIRESSVVDKKQPMKMCDLVREKNELVGIRKIDAMGHNRGNPEWDYGQCKTNPAISIFWQFR